MSCCSALEEEAEPFVGLHCSRPGNECLPNASRGNVVMLFIMVFQFTLYPFPLMPWRRTAVLIPFVKMLNIKYRIPVVGIWIHRHFLPFATCLLCSGVPMLVWDLDQLCLFLCSYRISRGL